MKKKIPYIFIILGLLVIIYPFARNAYSAYWENQMMQEAEGLLSSENSSYEEEDLTETVANNFTQMNRALEVVEQEDPEAPYDHSAFDDTEISFEGPESADNDVADNDSADNEVADNEVDEIKKGEVIGKIQIPSIDVNLPLLFGSDEHTLDRGAGQVIGTAAPGEIGNTGIAGHRANRDGRFFYRLNELDEGDEIIITTREGTFVYRVFDTKIVDPTDMSVLNRNQTHRIVTLITCHPRYTADYRLIVHGVLSD